MSDRTKQWTIIPEKTALVTIDLELGDKLKQSSRVHRFAADPEVMFRYMNEYMVPRINDLAGHCRKLGIPAIWVCSRPELAGPEDALHAQQLHPDLDARPEEPVIRKGRYSAFIPGASELPDVLGRLGRNTLIITGEATDVCVGTTVQDAVMLDYKVFVVSDLTATYSDERQRTALNVLGTHFARVMSYDEIMKDLARLSTWYRSGPG